MAKLLMIITVFCFVMTAMAEGEKKKITKLQVGVKKRVPEEECDQKSRKGDKLHMHYTGTLYDDGSGKDLTKKDNVFTINSSMLSVLNRVLAI